MEVPAVLHTKDIMIRNFAIPRFCVVCTGPSALPNREQTLTNAMVVRQLNIALLHN